MTHAGTQTVCVTHVVTHCCPPALLTQLYTSVMGLGAKTAGRRPGPDQTIGGARCCVWEARLHASDSVVPHTLTFQRTEHALVRLSARTPHGKRRRLSPSSHSVTSKSWYCSSVKDFLETTRTLRPSRAMFPHLKREKQHVLVQRQ